MRGEDIMKVLDIQIGDPLPQKSDVEFFFEKNKSFYSVKKYFVSLNKLIVMKKVYSLLKKIEVYKIVHSIY